MITIGYMINAVYINTIHPLVNTIRLVYQFEKYKKSPAGAGQDCRRLTVVELSSLHGRCAVVAVFAIDGLSIDAFRMRNLGNHVVAVDARPHLVILDGKAAVIVVDSGHVRIIRRSSRFIGMAFHAGFIVGEVDDLETCRRGAAGQLSALVEDAPDTSLSEPSTAGLALRRPARDLAPW